MGSYLSCDKFCCPSDKSFTFTECNSPKNMNISRENAFSKDFPLRINLKDSVKTTPELLVHTELQNSVTPDNSPCKNPRSLRRCVSIMPSKQKSFLARAREKSRMSIDSNFSKVSEDFENYKRKSVVYSEEDFFASPVKLF